MALTLVIAQGAPIGSGTTPLTPLSSVVGQSTNLMVTVTNTSASAVTLLSLVVNQAISHRRGATIEQPVIAAPNLPASQALPVLAPSVAQTFMFQVVFNSPAGPGVSPNNPGGVAPGQPAQEANAVFGIGAIATASDGSVGSTSAPITVLTDIAPYPQPTGGATQFNIGFDSNLTAVI